MMVITTIIDAMSLEYGFNKTDEHSTIYMAQELVVHT